MELSQLRESFLRKLAGSNDLDDPLALHQEYIESLKAGPGCEDQTKLLLEALERTTQTFIEDRRYANDPRYLRAWLDYASRCREPEDVFAFLSMRQVCIDLAAYYEEYAGYLERRKVETPGAIDKIVQIYQAGIERKAQPLERLKKYFNEFVQRRCPHLGTPTPQTQFSEVTKRQSWSQAQSSGISCWAVPKAPSGKARNIEVHGYRAELLEEGRLCFEEVRAMHYRLKPVAPPALPKLAMIDVDNVMDEDDLDDVPSLAVAVNPEDLTHISVYRDNTTDLKELARMAAAQNAQHQAAPPSCEKENYPMDTMGLASPIKDVEMTFADVEDPFDQIASGAFTKCPFKKDHRLSLIPEEPESTTLQSISSIGRTRTQSFKQEEPVLTPEIRIQMESLLNPGLIKDLLVVHESSLAKVRQLEKSVGRDGTGGNQTVSALKIANGHFFIERRLAPPSKVFMAVDLEADVSTGRCHQWALKIVSPPTKWEAHILSRLPRTCWFPELNSCCHYNDAMFLTSTFYEQGTLQKAFALCKEKFDELLVLFYSSQLLKMLQDLVQSSIVHTRIGMDHLMVRSTDFGGQWVSQYQSDGSQGWQCKGLALIGFGRAIDLPLLAKVDPSSRISHDQDMCDIAKVLSRLLALPTHINPDLTASHQFAALWRKTFSFLVGPCTAQSKQELADLVLETDHAIELASTQCQPSLKSQLTKLEIAILSC